MSELSSLEAKVYIDASVERNELASWFAYFTQGRADGATVVIQCGEIDVRNNEQKDLSRKTEFPKGFLYFSHVAEFYIDGEQEQGCKDTVSAIISYCWSNGVPAVAVCDYEENLPMRGGYNNKSVPWPQP